ncbi:hypothetical protein SPSIL_038940 [Sporomusa silvacetica DSM 10669]|uniref:RNA polymerase sigma-70 region 2 domain-containing protein n=1 Tax=Sporomusa silvacetica DSM 10669 TaxID=1123289 RepID=A0ABZ3IPP0_9FIRM|nr:sigma-70 family RNA polymerase sigma factor [Sporomusa silvacetica]OZC13799.1 ECF RNA polymerase sigma-E factor [Sporomusa silvacetica DSM 10669]
MSNGKESESFPLAQTNFENLYLAFWPKIHRYVTRLVGSQDAEDLTQEIFIKVEQAAATFRSESKLSTWIYRIATNAVTIDKMRSASHSRVNKKTIIAVINLVSNFLRY